MSELIKPEEVVIADRDGVEKTYIISRLPAIVGREVLARYPIANIPKLGDYAVGEEIMLKLMGYVAVPMDGGDALRLKTRALIDNHIPDGESLVKLELKMLEYNTSFFGQGRASSFLGSLISTHLPSIFKTLMDSLPPSFLQDLRAGLNSKRQ